MVNNLQILPNIDIVTCFFDIGRGSWVGPNLPSYLQRTTTNYFAAFERLLKLENRIVVFTSMDLLPIFDMYKREHQNLIIVGIEDWETNLHPELHLKVKKIQQDQNYIDMITPHQRCNPEYWSSSYVMVNFLKAYFVNYAIELGLIINNMVAWIDFGYAREDRDVPTTVWNYKFDIDKIHVFSVANNVPTQINLREIIANNTVFIQGCHIVASKDNWLFLLKEIYTHMIQLLSWNLVDDDQTLYLMSYILHPHRYKIHYINPNTGWFQIFRSFNNVKSI